MRVDHYEILGLSSSASQEDIKKAFRRLVKDLHPDRLPNGLEKESSEKKLKQIIASYKYLSHRRRGQIKKGRNTTNKSITKSVLKNKYLLDLSFYLQGKYQSAIAPHFQHKFLVDTFSYCRGKYRTTAAPRFQRQHLSNIISYLKGKYQSAIVPHFQHKYLLATSAFCKNKYRTAIAPHFENDFWLVIFPNFIDKLSPQNLEKVWKRRGAPANIIGAIFTYGLLGFFIIVVLVAMSPSW